MSAPLKLVSFKLCPFVQRSVITLLHKNVVFDIEYIDLANKPKWFLQLSPLGKVPLLQVGDTVLFESAVINEYLDEIHPPSFHPSDPLQKAQNRAVIELSSACLGSQYALYTAKEEDEYEHHHVVLKHQLSKLVLFKKHGTYFNGDNLHLVDFALAPLLQRCRILDEQYELDLLTDIPDLDHLANVYTGMNVVKNSVVPDFEKRFIDYLNHRQSYLIDRATFAS